MVGMPEVEQKARASGTAGARGRGQEMGSVRSGGALEVTVRALAFTLNDIKTLLGIQSRGVYGLTHTVKGPLCVGDQKALS